jgi:exodeoxyribonuclease V alpha subunit
MPDLLPQLTRSALFSDLSGHYYRFFQGLDPGAGELVWLSGALAVQAVLDGHSCLPLARLAGRSPFAETTADEPLAPDAETGPGGYRLPEQALWQQVLLASTLVGPPQANTALVLDGARLYLRRYFVYEERLAAEVRKRALPCGYPPEVIAPHLARLFPNPGPDLDWQQVAVATAALKRLALITGGPGTGKTHTVVRIIALLQLLAGPDRPLRIGLAAPTGKAASRLQEAMHKARVGLALGPKAEEMPIVQAQTIHRLLGSVRHSPYFLHNRERRLPLDLLVVDEVSMVDLAMMTKLIEAMPDEGRLVLLGDQDQLSSVEAGRVLADLCLGCGDGALASERLAVLRRAGVSGDTAEEEAVATTPLSECLVQLRHSYRFRADSGVGSLARAVLAGDHEQAMHSLAQGQGVSLAPAVVIGSGVREDEERLAERLVLGYGRFLQERDPATALTALRAFQLLCVHRHGPNGSLQLNLWFEEVLRRQGVIQQQGDSLWYPGRPLMVTGNHYSLGLFNGDLGVVLPAADGGLRVFFEAPGGGVRAIAPARVPAHETAFALTVHKSQGSEFDQVVLLLPEKPSRLLSRELIYTAITRARQGFALWGAEAVLSEGVATRIERDTGLQERLRAGE